MEAARILNISDKTVRRYVAKGKLTAKRTEFNEIAIPEDEIAHLLTELNEARAQFGQGEHAVPSSLSSVSIPSGTIPLTDTTLTETIKQLGKLQARVDVQDARIAELERRIVELEARNYPVIAENAPVQPTPTKPMDETSKTESYQNRTVDLPERCVLAKDFAVMHDVKESSFRRHLSEGIRGEVVEAETYKQRRYLTPEQQEAALAFWVRHGVRHTRTS